MLLQLYSQYVWASKPNEEFDVVHGLIREFMSR
jgi:hypothetical protein